MIVKLQTQHHLEFLSLEGGCRGLSESTLVKMSNCWKSHAAAHLVPCVCNVAFHCVKKTGSQIYTAQQKFSTDFNMMPHFE